MEATEPKLSDSPLTNSTRLKGKSPSFSASIKGALSKPRKEFSRQQDTAVHSKSSSNISSSSSLARSYTEETIQTSPDEISPGQPAPLRRAATGSSGASSQNSKHFSSVRIVGRGGQGSRPRPGQTKTALVNDDDRDSWEASRSSGAKDVDDHFTNARVTTSISTSTSKDRVRVVGRGGYGSKHRTPSLPSQPVSIAPQNRPITTNTSQVSSSAQQNRSIRLGARGGAGSRPRSTSLSGNTPDTGMKSIVALKIRLKARRKSKSSKDDPGPLSPTPLSPTSSLPPISTNHPFHSTHTHDPKSLTPIHSGPPTPTQASSSSHPTSPSFVYHDSNTPSSSSSSLASKHDRAGVPTKAERALGIVTSGTQIDQSLHHQSISPCQDVLTDAELIRYYRRASLPLSNIGSCIRADTVVLDGDREQECWIDSRFESESDKDGSSTPVSSIMFADRPPSPQPPKRRRSASASLVDAGTGLVLLRAPPRRLLSTDGYSEYTSSLNDTATTDDESSSLFTPQPSLDLTPDLTPDTPHTQPSPVSPMIFSERHSMFLPTTSKENLHLLGDPSALDLNATLPTVGKRGKRPQIDESKRTRAEAIHERYTRPDSPFVEYGASDTPHTSYHYERRRPRTATGRAEVTQGSWSGEWNRSNLQDVISSLRMLK
ncbi:hypothetical protein VKT23_018111 [Stygiomarasmius scandens]|uniref:Uncharacterized protein n=1 Tax=Marasmiellus scandens TaxID=2682957 RepID=A0ABR1IQ00_9AGAR